MTSGCVPTTESTGPYPPNDTATPSGNVDHLMATTTTRRPGLHSKLRDLSEDGSAPKVLSGVALCPIDIKADAANCAGHYRIHGYL